MVLDCQLDVAYIELILAVSSDSREEWIVCFVDALIHSSLC